MQQLYRRSFTTVTTSRRVYVRAKSTMARSSEGGKTYEETIAALNTLQSNAASILLSQKQKLSHEENLRKLKRTLLYLESTGINYSQLSKLSVIHVTGTKGKGSTCSVCEAILRKRGNHTGFFSSPHLITVRERIRIDGRPLEEQKFIKYFWEVKQALNQFQDTEIGLPPYFNFLFIMAVNVFLKEQVDVAIVEVGIGGQYDTTNILPNVAVCGITSIGHDHTNILGSTVAEIAWQKAGIMKPSAVAFTVPNQTPEALDVLYTRSAELKCPLFIVPSLDTLSWPNDTKQFMQRLPAVHQINVALALQLAEAWILKHDGKSVSGIPLQEVKPATATALQSWCMPGRMQVLPGKVKNTTFFIDGAHTPESTLKCMDWFKNASKARLNGVKTRQVLLCNVTGSRDLKSVLSPFLSHPFDHVYFTPNIAKLNDDSGECWSSLQLSDFQKKRLLELEVLWMKERPVDVAPVQNVSKVECVAEAVEDITMMAMNSKPEEWHILITGSLLLVGSALSVLDPNLEMSSALQHF